jgi:hypothetical protein
MTQYLMQATSDDDASLQTWLSVGVPDFAATGFPGPGAAVAGTIAIVARYDASSGAPLSNVFYVDPGYTGASNGAASAPFKTLTDAVAAVDALGPNAGGGVLLCPGDYSGEPSIGWAGTGSPPRKLSIAALVPSQDGAATILPTLSLSGSGVTSLRDLTAPLAGDGPVIATNCTIYGTSNNDVEVIGGSFQGQTGSGGLTSLGANLGSITDCVFLNARDGTVTGGISCNGIDVTFLGTLIAEAAVTFSGSPGVLSLDSIANYYWLVGTPSLTNGTKALIHNTTP